MSAPLARLATLATLVVTAISLTGLAAAATAPAAITGPVNTVGGSSATVTGTVNPNGTATNWNFEYGTTTSYGAATTAQSAGSGSVNITVSASLSGLSPGTTYHYRLDGSSSAGSAQGADGIFTTAATPGATTQAASGLSATAATLNGSVLPNGQQTSYSFQYGTTTSYGSSTPTSAAGSGTSAIPVSAAVSGLQAGQTYHYRLVATSSVGTSDGADLTFTLGPNTRPAVTTAPATSVSASAATLNGTVDPNGQQTTVFFQYGTTTSYGSQTTPASAGSGTKTVAVDAALSGLTQGSVYHFRLVAESPAGTSYGSDHSFGSTFLPAVQTGSAEGAAATTVTLTGSVNPKGLPTSWYFELGTTTAYGTTSTIGAAGSGTAPKSVSVTVARLAAATTYHYRIVATSKAGTSYGGDVTFTTPAALTLVAESTASVFGRALTLSGSVAGSGPGVKVTVLAEPYGSASFVALATVLSQAGGSWSYQAHPTVATTFEASGNGATSTPLAVGVRPAITLRLISGGRFLVRVVAAAPFSGRVVKFQRLLAGGGFATVARARLGARSSVVFAGSLLPFGSSTIRIAMSVNQAGRGYLAGFSRTVAYVRR